MGWTVCNATAEHQTISETDLWDGGITFHSLSLIVGGVCALLACAVSIFLIMCHATHYSKPMHQRHIIRILFMVPVYSIVAWLSILFYNDSVYFEVIGDCYEAFCISAFFSLMCHYIAPDLHSQKDYFRGIQPKAWLWPLSWFQSWKCCFGHRGAWRNPRSGLTWFNIIWAGVFQYCVMRVLMTVVSVITQATGTYCEESLSPAFAHIWVLAIESVCVSIAMYCLIQFYVQINKDIAEYHPFTKILSIKLVIFLSFWQSTFINLLISSGAVNATKKLAIQDLKYALPELMINIEMFIFSIMHLWAFSWKPYAIANANQGEVTDFFGNGKATYEGGRYGMRALVDAMNPLDLLKAVGRSVRWLAVGRKHRMEDPSYQAHHESIGLEPPEAGVVTNATAYTGAAAVPGARTTRYGADEEGEILLANAQSNPEAAHLGTSPYASDSDSYMHEHENPGRFYNNNNASSYDEFDHGNPYLAHHDAQHPYPADGPLREAVPMPMPDPYRPPPPYPDDHRS
ncbi:hypothetical protein N7448_000318 [Penicillium atrosanguineum]|uniref:DUF300-domain-containing protein n=1 Tax=Penicillium atrosanguineum TaxID=1132637 RepID=A0A9W9Q590_9EURO|nr:hypothetical protein N7526_006027 [Penicillium atrosanguineum]KAJ5148740.1 hypothetical protein N7448_000318 [Penicillium atrosanguineum]KAJ5323532.1 hypothetical protein N7476_002132 [Penicillium atrosanguineum]